MSKKSDNTTLNQLTLFAGDSLANLTVWPGREEARKMTATSGLNFYALLENSDRLGLLGRMFQASYQCISTRCYLTWKVKRTPAGRLIFQLAPSMPRTDGSGSGLLPTPRAIYGEHPGITDRSHLTGAIHFWPTPRANKTGGYSSPGWRPTLEQVVMYRTPNSTDWKNRGTEEYRKGRQIQLQTQVGGQLNPTWVEWLMGFPLGWTDLEPSETP